ncbi:MAG: peptidoglycan DD-metalloendopeptidase family protein [Bacilli bacterium]
MDKVNIKAIVVSILISLAFLFLGFKESPNVPETSYRVYLEGKPIGLIASKEKLESYIDREQDVIKNKYKVDKVYAPNDLDIVKEITYNEKLITTEAIYNKIKGIKPFTINGYAITIKGVTRSTEQGQITTPTEVIYCLDKAIFEEAIGKATRSFIPSETYNAYLTNTQKPITDTGTIIENVDIANDTVIQKQKISVNEEIFTNVEDLSRYLLFGSLDGGSNYIVKEGDTIKDVAFNNKMSSEEFLIANPNLHDTNTLLYPGQTVTLASMSPKVNIVEDSHKVEIVQKPYETQINYDNSLLIGITKTIQEGKNGSSKVTSKIRKVNGVTEVAVTANIEELSPTVNAVIVKGGKSSGSAVPGVWAWPTLTPYIITTGFEWRWGQFHDGIDISGTGEGSPIKAVNNGVVIASEYQRWPNGNYVYVDHGNGYVTTYLHLSSRYVSVGENVVMGQAIGAMGRTGWATGTHLHFGVFKGGYPYRGGHAINPWLLFR